MKNITKNEFIKFVGDFMNYNENVSWESYDLFSVRLAEKFGCKSAYEIEMLMYTETVDGKEYQPYDDYDDYKESLKYKTAYINRGEK